jgi:hypothetical protein
MKHQRTVAAVATRSDPFFGMANLVGKGRQIGRQAATLVEG